VRLGSHIKGLVKRKDLTPLHENQDQTNNGDGDNRINDRQTYQADENSSLERHEASKLSRSKCFVTNGGPLVLQVSV